MCRVPFCRIGVPGRCVALPLLAQSPHGLSEIMDLIQSSEVYECFESNTIEVEYMLDYLTTRRIMPAQIYKDVCCRPIFYFDFSFYEKKN
jgi:E3 ubiquitin-protein ligase CHFR